VQSSVGNGFVGFESERGEREEVEEEYIDLGLVSDKVVEIASLCDYLGDIGP
jgi:hypothetical protein